MHIACLVGWCCCTFLVDEPFGAPDRQMVELSLPIEKSVLQIDNPQGQAGRLLILHSGKRLELARVSSFQKQVVFRLPTGRYFLQVHGSNQLLAAPLPGSRNHQRTVVRIVPQKLKSDSEWAMIPAGPALIGDTLGIGAEDERPWRIQTTGAFYLAKTEVTNEQYATFLNAQTSLDDRWIDLKSRKCLILRQEDMETGKTVFRLDNKQDKAAGQLPVVMVSKFGAEAYCRWLTRKTGVPHRLPTETEWEKAARGPFSNIYSYGNRYDQASANQESGSLKPVKSYRASPFGLYDMTGNVFEWTANKYDQTKMTDVMNHTLRGGSFMLDGMYLRNSFRMRQSPGVMTDDIGFRVLREIPLEKK